MAAATNGSRTASEAAEGSSRAAAAPSVDLSATTFKRLHPRTYLERFLSSHIREDGRLFSSWRPTSAVMGAVASAEGSCLVRMGVTTVVAGIKAEIAKPDFSRAVGTSSASFAYPGSSQAQAGNRYGWLVPNIEISPLSSARGRPGPPTEEGQLLCDRITEVLSSQTRPLIDVTSLCIEPDEAAWCLYLDITVVSNDGNLLDAAVLASVGALMNTRLPKATYDEHSGQVTCLRSKSSPLRILSLPLASSFGVYEGAHLLSDPSAFEGAFTANSHLVVGLAEWTDEGRQWVRSGGAAAEAKKTADGEDEEMETDEADQEETIDEADLSELAITYLHQVGRCRAILPPDELEAAKKGAQGKTPLPSGLLTPQEVIASCLAKARQRYAQVKGVLQAAQKEAEAKRADHVQSSNR